MSFSDPSYTHGYIHLLVWCTLVQTSFHIFHVSCLWTFLQFIIYHLKRLAVNVQGQKTCNVIRLLY